MRRTGFTLTETLVVIGIMSITAGILTPVILNAKEAGRITHCKSNLKQLYTAVMLYRMDQPSNAEEGSAAEMGLPQQSNVMASWGSARWMSSLNGYQRVPGITTALIDTVCNKYSPEEVAHMPDGQSFPPVVRYCPQDEGGSWERHSKQYKEQSIVFFDRYCTFTIAPSTDPYARRRAIGISMQGNIVTKIRTAPAPVWPDWFFE